MFDMPGNRHTEVEVPPMAGNSAIEWTESTWNPVTGCDRISPGCAHCYALDLAARLKRMGQPKYQRDGVRKSSGPGFGLTLHPDVLEAPLAWKQSRVIFVNSMSDLFHEEIPEDFVRQVFDVMVQAEQHTFQVLTKRQERLTELAPDLPWPRNVWMGVSIENRKFVHRADHLRAIPASVRFVSAEPLLGPLDDLHLDGIDWLIAGGESGPHHRIMDPDWARDLRDRCASGGIPFFFKQWGGRTSKSGGRVLDGKTHDGMPVAKDRSDALALV